MKIKKSNEFGNEIEKNKKESTNNNQSKKRIIIFIILLIMILVSIFIGVLFYKNIQDKKDYEKSIETLATDIYTYELVAEYHSSYIHSVWYNAIFKKRDVYTDKYAFPEDKYGYGVNMWVSFQTAINNYTSNNKESLEKLKEKEKDISLKMNELQSSINKDYQKHMDILVEMYSNFNILVSLATNPTGTYKEYGEKCNRYKENFNTEYKKLLILIPNIKKEEN